MKKIAQITDLHLDDFLAKGTGIDARKNFESALNLARSRDISTVILTGDLGAPESSNWLFERVRAHGFDFQIMLGNHDLLADYRRFDFLKPLIKADGLYFSKTIEGFECIFLDSRAEEINKPQLNWLGRISKSHDPLFVFIHHPILDCGNTIADRLFTLKNRDEVKQTLVETGREVSIFCGHYHYRNALEIKESNLHQFLTPSIFGQIKPDGEEIEPDPNYYIAYREIWLADKKFQTEVVEVR
jgi:3',5'-cyclic AMP phosphodiesterase CpdA